MNDKKNWGLFQGNISIATRVKKNNCKWQNANDNGVTFLELNIRMEGGHSSSELYDKGDGFNFPVLTLP